MFLNIVGILDEDGNYVVKYRYDGFGNITKEIVDSVDSVKLNIILYNPFI